MPGAWRGAVDNGVVGGSVAVHVKGLAEVQRAFRRIGGELPKDLRWALVEIAKPIQAKAKAGAPSSPGHPGAAGRLRGSIKISATQKAVSVYSNLIYARVQDQGGRVGRNHATLLSRGSVSQYMTKAVRNAAPIMEAGLSELGNLIATKYEGG